MPYTCGNAQEFLVYSLSRLSPVVNRNGRKDSGHNTSKDHAWIYKQGLYKIIPATTRAGELSKDCHKSLSIKEGGKLLSF